MRYTEAVVKAVSAEAAALTNDTFRLGNIGCDVGYGVRYIDDVQQLVWLGRTGAWEAAAYYAAAALEWASAEQNSATPSLPENIAAVVTDMDDRTLPQAVEKARRLGAGDGRSRWKTTQNR